MLGSSSSATLQLACGPQFLNAAESSLTVQAAVKNLATNAVFYFSIPIALESLFVPVPPMDLAALVAAWKGVDEALEVSSIVNGTSSLSRQVIYLTFSMLLDCFISLSDVFVYQ